MRGAVSHEREQRFVEISSFLTYVKPEGVTFQLPAGRHRIEVEAPGHAKRTVEIDLEKDLTEVAVALEPLHMPPKEPVAPQGEATDRG